MHRHRVHHLVGDNDAAEALGQALEKLHPVAEPLSLALAQGAAGLEDQVLAVELLQQGFGERAAARAELENRTLERLQLSRERAAEKRAELRRGDEIALGAELARAARVVAQARRVQRELHVAGEGDPAAGGGDLGADPF